jgi:hypothetical protein
MFAGKLRFLVLLTALSLGSWASGSWAGPLLQSSVLPTSRAGKVGSPVTYFSNIINAGDTTGTGCLIRPHSPGNLLATFSYQAYLDDAVTPLAAIDTPVDIAAGTTQLFVISFTPFAGIGGSQIVLDYVCTDGAAEVLAPRVPGVNTPVLSATFADQPDIITIGGTATSDGIVVVPSLNGVRNFESFAVSAVNIGTVVPTGPVLVTADAGDVRRLKDDRTHRRANGLQLCETDPATSFCTTPFSPFIRSTFSGSEVHTYAVLLTSNTRNGAPLFADMARVFVRFDLDVTPAGETTPVSSSKYGATSVAFTIQFSTATAPHDAAQGIYDARFLTATNRYLSGELLVSNAGNRWTAMIRDPDSGSVDFFSGNAVTDRLAAPDPNFSLTATLSGFAGSSSYDFSGIWHTRAFVSGSFAPSLASDDSIKSKLSKPLGVDGESGSFRALATGLFDEDSGAGFGDPGHDVFGASYNISGILGGAPVSGSFNIGDAGLISGSLTLEQGPGGGTCTLSGVFSGSNGRNLYDVDMDIGGAGCASSASFSGGAYGFTGTAFDGSDQEKVKIILAESTGQAGMVLTLVPATP